MSRLRRPPWLFCHSFYFKSRVAQFDHSVRVQVLQTTKGNKIHLCVQCQSAGLCLRYTCVCVCLAPLCYVTIYTTYTSQVAKADQNWVFPDGDTKPLSTIKCTLTCTPTHTEWKLVLLWHPISQSSAMFIFSDNFLARSLFHCLSELRVPKAAALGFCPSTPYYRQKVAMRGTSVDARYAPRGLSKVFSRSNHSEHDSYWWRQ